jgi:nitroreductase
MELFELPENETPVLLMPLGYPKEGVGPLPNHTARKALEETVKYL